MDDAPRREVSPEETYAPGCQGRALSVDGSVPRDAGSERQPGSTRGALILWIVGFID
jgi:hypothetical protein